MLRTGSEGGCYEHIPLDKSGEDSQRIQLKRMLIKEPVPTVNDCSTLFSADMSQAKDGELLIVQFISRGWDVLVLLVFPHDYICAFLAVWKSY